jgi:hypothetical protein
MADSTKSGTDLLVLGAGHLGGRVVSLWQDALPTADILAETASTSRHGELSRDGVSVRLRKHDDPACFSNVLVSLPPSGAGDYRNEMERAVGLWNGAGRLVMVSSTAVYMEQDGGSCHEGALLAQSSRALRLLVAEECITAAGGIVVRMAGLYDLYRGPHIVYLRTRESPRRPEGLINLIHYDDAAELCLAALKRGESDGVYIGCDDEPIQRLALTEAAFNAEVYAGKRSGERCKFNGHDGPLGRRCCNTRTRLALGWQPRYASFLMWLDLVNSNRRPTRG